MVDTSIIHDNWEASKHPRAAFNIAVLKLPHSSKHPVPELLLDHFNLETGQKLMAAG